MWTAKLEMRQREGLAQAIASRMVLNILQPYILQP
jgi:hypothetical protein